jgi:hypothetical protein
VTTTIQAQAAGASLDSFAAAHGRLLADKDIQFQLGVAPRVEPPKPPVFPEWLDSVFKAIGGFFNVFGPVFTYLFWALLALVVGAIVYFILREFTDIRFPWQKKKVEAEEDIGWTPDAAPARALLAEADALAAEGRFDEAAHLILLRSVEDIERRKPDLLKPSSTAREIVAAQSMPEKARATFGLIARHVEASLFGGQALDASGWNQCRDAYGRFALAGEWQ